MNINDASSGTQHLTSHFHCNPLPHPSLSVISHRKRTHVAIIEKPDTYRPAFYFPAAILWMGPPHGTRIVYGVHAGKYVEEWPMQKEKSSFNPVKSLFNLSFLPGVIQQGKLAWMLFRDSRVPVWTKAIPVLTLLYIVSPLDLIPDFIPVLGQMEDVAILGIGLNMFINLAPKLVVQEHRMQLQTQR
jgi:uncharacterized membrane protein YkvA (DUF1232 family)